jgi:hypothetical protein
LAHGAIGVTDSGVLKRLLRLVFVVTLIAAPATMRAQDAREQDAPVRTPGMAIDCHDTGRSEEPGHASRIDCAAFCTATLPDQGPSDFADLHGAALTVALPTRNLRCRLLEVATPPPRPGEDRRI